MTGKRIFQKPVVVVSRCIEFDHVRYNGDMITSHAVSSMKPHITFIPICPEVEIGLGIPRDTIRIVLTEEGERLIQPSTERDLTDEMSTFCSSFLDSLPTVDGFIMKNKSPTSGISEVKRYPSAGKSAPIGKGPGFFGRMILDRYTDYPIEDEGRIRNRRIREHFLTRIFCLADLRAAEEKGTMQAIIRFHTENKLLFMAYSQPMLRKLGAIVGNRERQPAADIFSQYRPILLSGMRRAPRFTSEINVALHSFGHLKKSISRDEKAFFLDELESYRQGRAPLSGLKTLLRAWILRSGTPELAEQTWFAPYPDPLMTLEPEDTERGRDMEVT
ncbi:cytoplasmic protein [Methanocalculus chunghsingensis]|uniref:Cytoplasmic protein n=2 Tax=Methanocalculus chunghsingensis TaxID=156457 RepID=A0A8J7W874_9EURY|nr:cytoplasmic protein [Methanocalculus chunghsingensis]